MLYSTCCAAWRMVSIVFTSCLSRQNGQWMRNSISKPRTEVQRAGLSRDANQWIILNEWNRDIVETSFYIADIEGKGSFSKIFTDQLLNMLKEVLRADKIRVVNRD